MTLFTAHTATIEFNLLTGNNAMMTIKIGTTVFNCKPESLHKIKTHCEKVDKAAMKWKESVPKKASRVFPRDSRHLYSTAEYVKAYLALNSLRYRYDGDDIHNGYTLNLQPTTWPMGEDTFEEVAE